MLKCLNHAERLVFHANSDKNIIIPKEFRDTLVPPLEEMDEIEVFYKTRIYVDLADGMLWICPQLVHGELTGTHDSSCCFCTSHPSRCWRHSVKQFDLDATEEESKKKMMSYLMENFKKAERNAIDRVALE